MTDANKDRLRELGWPKPRSRPWSAIPPIDVIEVTSVKVGTRIVGDDGSIVLMEPDTIIFKGCKAYCAPAVFERVKEYLLSGGPRS